MVAYLIWTVNVNESSSGPCHKAASEALISVSLAPQQHISSHCDTTDTWLVSRGVPVYAPAAFTGTHCTYPWKAWSQISTLSWLRDQPSFELRYYCFTVWLHLRSLSEGSAFLSYLIEVAGGYMWCLILCYLAQSSESHHECLPPSASRRSSGRPLRHSRPTPARGANFTAVHYAAGHSWRGFVEHSV